MANNYSLITQLYHGFLGNQCQSEKGAPLTFSRKTPLRRQQGRRLLGVRKTEKPLQLSLPRDKHKLRQAKEVCRLD